MVACVNPPRHVSTNIEAAWRIMGYVWGDGNPPDQNRGMSGPAYGYLNSGVTLTEIQRCAGVLGWKNSASTGDYFINSGGKFICLRSSLHAACGIGATVDFYHRCMLDVPSFVIPRTGLEAFLASVFETEGRTTGQAGSIGVADEGRGTIYCPRSPGLIALMNQQNLAAFQIGGNSSGCGVVGVPTNRIEQFPLPLIVTARYNAPILAPWPDGCGAGGGGGGGGTGTGKPHIMVIAMENRGYSSSSGLAHYVLGHAEFPKVNALLGTYGRLSNCWAAYGPNGSGPGGVDGSHPMYVALFGGSNFTITSDAVPADPGTGLTNTILLDQLNTAGISWGAYAEDISTDLTVDKSEADGKTYIARHAAPIADFAHFNVSPHLGNVKDAGSTLGYGAGTPSWPTLINDLNGATPPAFIWFTPTAHNQGHGNGPTTGAWRGDQFADGDNFLDKIIKDIQATTWYKNGGNIIVWWDEGDNKTTSAVQSGGGQKMVFVVSDAAAARSTRTVNTACNEFGLLHDIEDAYGLAFLNHAGDADATIGAGALTPLLDLPDASPPAAPTGLTATPGNAIVTLDWADNTEGDLAGYNVYRGGTKITVTPITTSNFVDTGRTNGTTYTYRVSAVDTSGNESAQSVQASATPSGGVPVDTTPPAVPTNFVGTPGTTNVSLTWTAPPDADLNGFRVFRDGSQIAAEDKTVTFYIDPGPLVADQQYVYRLEAFDLLNNTSSTGNLVVTTLAEPPPVVVPPPPPPPPGVETGVLNIRLGCDNTRVHIYQRGGIVPVKLDIPWTAVEWHRSLDNYSSAGVELQGLDCFAQYGFIVPRLHEVVVERKEITDKWRRVWAGPIEAISVTPQSGPGVRISAHDVMWTALSRKIHRDHFWRAGTDLSSVFRDAIIDAMSVDNSIGLVLDIQPSGVVITDDQGRKVLASEDRTCDGVIDELQSTNLDWTVVDRVVTVRGQELFPLALAPLSDNAFTIFNEFLIWGASAPTRVDVVGSGRGDAANSVVGRAAIRSVETEYGVVEHVANEPDIRDVRTATVAAQNYVANFGGIPKWIFQGASLDPNHCPIPISQLVPGHRIPLDLGRDGRSPRIREIYRLTSVDAYVGAETNHIDVAMVPLGPVSDEPAINL